MKKVALLLVFSFTILFSSCSSDDSSPNQDPTPQFAMTAKINGISFEANNPFGNNKYSSTNIWDYFPTADFVMLQGRKGGVFGNPEINIWLKRTDIAIGTYTVNQETFSTTPSHHIDLIDNSTQESQYTKGGTIVITGVNTSTKIVSGTFSFTSANTANDPDATVNNTVTDGTFRYQYED